MKPEITPEEKVNLILMWRNESSCDEFPCSQCIYQYKENQIIHNNGIYYCPKTQDYKTEMRPAMKKFLTEEELFLELI